MHFLFEIVSRDDGSVSVWIHIHLAETRMQIAQWDWECIYMTMGIKWIPAADEPKWKSGNGRIVAK